MTITDDELEELFDAASFCYGFDDFHELEQADILAAMRTVRGRC